MDRPRTRANLMTSLSFALRTSHFVILLSLLLAVGCNRSLTEVGLDAKDWVVQAPPPTVGEVSAAYQAQDYQKAYTLGRRVADDADQPVSARDTAAYIAGLAAREMGQTGKAIHFLERASRSVDRDLANDAAIELGLTYAAADRNREAATTLIGAADTLRGEDRARAYYHAAVAQQKLGQRSQARTNLLLASSLATGPELAGAIRSELAVTGYTVQAGVFADPSEARQVADEAAVQTGLLGLNPPVLVEGTDELGRSVTAVQIGRFTTWESATRQRDQLKLPQALVVPLSQ